MVELRAYAACAPSLGPHYAQRWLGHVQTTGRGNAAERTRYRAPLLSFLRATYQSDALPTDRRPAADEYAPNCDVHQRAMASAVAQALSARPLSAGRVEGASLASGP